MSTNQLTAEIAADLKFAPRLRRCGQCQGEGVMRSLCEYEEERGITDACYHCANGLVDEETYQADQEQAVVERLARLSVKFQAELDDSEEGFGFAAAENGMSLRDYVTECAWAAERHVAEVLASLAPAVLADVLAVWA